MGASRRTSQSGCRQWAKIQVLGSSSLCIKTALSKSAETFGSEMSSGMFQLMAQRRIGKFILTDFMKSSAWRTSNTFRQGLIVKRYMNVLPFQWTWRNGAVFDSGLKMRFLEACVCGLVSIDCQWYRTNDELYWSLSKRVYHVLETYTRTTETHQTLWV